MPRSFNRSAIFRRESPCRRIRRTSDRNDGSISTGGRPSLVPRCRATSSATRVRSPMRSRSSSANTAAIFAIARPWGIISSIDTSAATMVQPAEWAVSIRRTYAPRLRASRSPFDTTRMSPRWSRVVSDSNLGRRTLADPLATSRITSAMTQAAPRAVAVDCRRPGPRGQGRLPPARRWIRARISVRSTPSFHPNSVTESTVSVTYHAGPEARRSGDRRWGFPTPTDAGEPR